MKYLLPTALMSALLAGPVAMAQTAGPITLTQANYLANPTATDRYLPMHGALHPAFVLPQPGPNQVWDYSTLTADSSALEQTYLPPPATGPFTAATRRYLLPAQHPQAYAFPSPGLWKSFTGEQFEELTSRGLENLGHTLPEQQWPIERADKTPGDFLRLPAAVNWRDGYSPLPLPLTATSSKRTFSYYRDWMEVTIQSLGLNATGTRVPHHATTQTDVVGYGTLKLPKPTGGSVAVPVLMVRTHIQQVDSAYTNGRPAPAAVLQALHMKQAQRHDIYQTAFYRENSSQPALLLYHTDASFSTLRNWFSIWFSGEESLQRVINGVRPASASAGALQVHPNPVADGRLTLELPGERQAVQLVVRDLLGRPVATAAAVTGQPTPVLRGVRAGLYVVEATTAAGQRSTVRVRVE